MQDSVECAGPLKHNVGSPAFIHCMVLEKAQHWTWPVNLQALPWPWESAEQQKWSECCKDWVSIDHTACGKWSRLLTSYNNPLWEHISFS